MDEIPRRAQVLQMVQAELAIRSAIQKVEEMGCDVVLTEAVVLLGAAQSKVADFVDRIKGEGGTHERATTLAI